MRLQITSRLRASAGKTDQSASHCNPGPIRFVPLLNGSPWFLHLRQKLALGGNLKSTSVRFSRDIFQSRGTPARFGCLRRECTFCSLFLRKRRPSVFCVYFADRSERRDGPSHNSKRVAIIQPQVSCPRDRPAFTFQRSGVFSPRVQFYEKRIRPVNWKRIYYFLSIFRFAVIHLTSFALSIPLSWLERSYESIAMIGSFQAPPTYSDSSQVRVRCHVNNSHYHWWYKSALTWCRSTGRIDHLETPASHRKNICRN